MEVGAINPLTVTGILENVLMGELVVASISAPVTLGPVVFENVATNELAIVNIPAIIISIIASEDIKITEFLQMAVSSQSILGVSITDDTAISESVTLQVYDPAPPTVVDMTDYDYMFHHKH